MESTSPMPIAIAMIGRANFMIANNKAIAPPASNKINAPAIIITSNVIMNLPNE